MEKSWAISQKLHIELSHNPAIPLLGICPQEWKTGTQTNIHEDDNRTIHSSQKAETAQMSING